MLIRDDSTIHIEVRRAKDKDSGYIEHKVGSDF